MPLTLSVPISIGDLTKQIVVDELEIVSFSIGLWAGREVVSFTLIHPASGQQFNYSYAGDEALAFWGSLDSSALQSILSSAWGRLMADKVVPAGTLNVLIPAAAAAASAVAASASKASPPAPLPGAPSPSVSPASPRG